MNVESSCLGFLSAKITFLNLFKAQFSYLKQNRAICEASNPSEIYLHHINQLFYSFAKTSETVIRITRRKEESERVDWDREEGGATYETESSHMSAYLPLYQKMDAEDSDFDEDFEENLHCHWWFWKLN